MNIFEYVSLMKELGTPVAIAGIAILALFLIIIVLKMLGGMRRGTWRQLVRTGMTLLSAIASYIIAKIMSGHIIGSLNVESLDGLITSIESYVPEIGDAIRQALSSLDTEIFEYIILLPATIIVIPVLTTVIFLLLNLVLKIVRAIIIKIIGFKKAKSNPQRLGGAVLAAVQAIIWMVMVTLPISALLSLTDAAYGEAINADSEGDNSEIVETYEEYISPFTKNPALCFVGSMGGRAMSDGIATVRINNESTNMRQEVLSVAHIILNEAGVLNNADFTALNENEKAALSSILDTLAKSPYMSRILVGVIHTVPAVLDNDLLPNELGEEYQGLLDNVMVFLKTVHRESLNEDLTTIMQFYFGFCDSGLMNALSDGTNLVQFISDDYNGDKHILGMINSLSGNPRSKGIVDGLYNFVLNIAFYGDSDSSSEEAPKISVEDVKEGLNNIVSVNKSDYETQEEYKEALSSTIKTTVNDTIGVELDEETVDEIADYVDANYSEQLEDLTDEEFNELMFEVIDIYQSYQNGEEINPDDLENIFGD